jgi:hypothetical protein
VGYYDASANLFTTCDPIHWSLSPAPSSIDPDFGTVAFGGVGQWTLITASHNPEASFSFLIWKQRIFNKLEDVTDQVVTIFAGEQVSLSGLAEPALEVFTENWSIEGEPILDYITRPSFGMKVTYIADSRTFYWYKPGTYQVSYIVSLNSFPLTSVTKKVTFIVTKLPAQISVFTNPIEQYLDMFNGQVVINLSVGNLTVSPARPGFKLVATVDSNDEYEVGWFNIVEATTDLAVYSTTGIKSISRGRAYDGSDLPYLSGFEFDDSPAAIAEVFGLVSLKATKLFTVYLMFRSKKPTSIWIPIKKVPWGMAADLVKMPDGSFAIQNPIHSTAQNVQISDEDELPQWNTNFPG